MESNSKSHNLSIEMYSLNDLLELFQLPSKPTIEDMKRAKMVVLKMHPDKSQLPSNYFIFYKKAYEMVYQYYQEATKTTIKVPTTEQYYSPINESADQSIKTTISKMGQEKFQTKFNELFETMIEKPKEGVNDWFKLNDPLFQYDEATSSAGLSQAIEKIKKSTVSVIKYTGVKSMNSMGPSYNNLYDNDDETYVSCDPFGKLKYDDLRKVHKDQTVLAVSESDYNKLNQYSSMDHLQRERGSLNIKHVDKSEHERFFKDEENEMNKKMAIKQHESNLKTMDYTERNKKVMTSFLHLNN
jgi:hypothetical protein